MRPNRDTWAMSLAVLTAQRTTCIRRAVGCVLLSARGHVLATGNNGVAAGQPHCNEPAWRTERLGTGDSNVNPLRFVNICKGHDLPPGQDSCEAIHAEQNALLQCRDVYEIDTAYVTLSPCMACCKLLLNTGCRRIVFLEEWADPKPKALWTGAGREWTKMETNGLQAMGAAI